LGDSHAALFGQGCLESGMAKATYGTGSSIMMNIGTAPIESRNGLVTSLAWKYRDQVNYVMEGNLNYTGAVIRWIEKDLGLAKASETQALAESANQEDTTYLVPAFTGLGAPYWRNDAKAMICGITRLTGKAELVKAGLDCIAYQITDIVKAMERDTGMKLSQLRVDGGPTRNGYLMQLQSDLLESQVRIPSSEELSGIGAAYMAGLTAGVFDTDVFSSLDYSSFTPSMNEKIRQE
jgi:glycerol kinase